MRSTLTMPYPIRMRLLILGAMLVLPTLAPSCLQAPAVFSTASGSWSRPGRTLRATGIAIGLLHRWRGGRVALRVSGAGVAGAGMSFLWHAILRGTS